MSRIRVSALRPAASFHTDLLQQRDKLDPNVRVEWPMVKIVRPVAEAS